MLKRIISLALTIVLLFSLSACEKAGTELSQLMIIQGIGIDYKDDIYKVTVEILNNEQSGSPNGNSQSDNKTKIYSAQGKSISEALRLLTTKSGNVPLFAHNRVIVINENLQEKSISHVMEFFVRNYDSRVSQLLCVAKGKSAEDIIRARLLDDTVKSEILENLLEESYMQSIVPRVRVIDAVNILQNPLMSLCIPAVTVTDNGENEDYALTGCALYNTNGQIASFITTQQAKGLAFLSDSVKGGFLSGSLPNDEGITFLINKSKTKYKVRVEDGKLIYSLVVNISCDIDEISNVNLYETDIQLLNEIKACIKKTISEKMKNTLEILQNNIDGDCIYFCKILELKNNDLYQEIKNNWQQLFPTIETEITVDVTIRRIGEEVLKGM